MRHTLLNLSKEVDGTFLCKEPPVNIEMIGALLELGSGDARKDLWDKFASNQYMDRNGLKQTMIELIKS